MNSEKESGQEGLPKLVRDRIPKRIKANGEIPVTHKATSDTEYVNALRDKLLEEAKELVEARTKTAFIEEIADVYEVLEAFMEQAGINPRNVQRIKETKQVTHGKFSKGIILDRIDKTK